MKVDDRIAACAVLGHGEPCLSALIIPTAKGAAWFAGASEGQVLLKLSYLCRSAPAYAVPRDFVLLDYSEAKRRDLLTPNGRFRRASLPGAYAEIKATAKQQYMAREKEMTA